MPWFDGWWGPKVGTIIEPVRPLPAKEKPAGISWPHVMLAIVIIMAPLYLIAAWHKDERANGEIRKCEALGFSHRDCRRHVRDYFPLPTPL